VRAGRNALFLLYLAIPAAVSGQHAFNPEGSFDGRVPTPRSMLGYEPGERFTPHSLLATYYARVAAASPRVVLDTTGRTVEGRPMLLAIVTSEANQQRIATIRALAKRLADPRGATPAELDQAVRELPAIVWLGYSVHGNEASGVEAGIAFLYQLAAGQDEETRLMLDSTVVLIDAVQNPDGHERHVQYVNRMTSALGVQSSPAALINDGDWPGARTSHYYFDLNRDWFVQSHPETRSRIATMLRWWPHIAVDLHEMGSSSSYYFAPPMDPVNKNIPTTIWKWWDIIASANASAFDRFGWSFFRREGYDDFYPGYGDSWPTLTGAVGMTYEQASSSGGAIRRTDGTLMTLAEATHHHYATSYATTLITARRRTERIRDYLEFRRTAISDAERAPLRQVIIERDAWGRSDSLVGQLLSDSIEVHRLTSATQVRNANAYGLPRPEAATFAAGWYVIDMAQPQGRLARALLEPDAQLDSSFIAEELERRRQAIGDRFYDMTGWSLPFLFRVRAWWVSSPLTSLERVARLEAPALAAPADAAYGYGFAPGSDASTRMLAALLADSVRVWFAPRSYRSGGLDFPHGLFVVRTALNDATVHAKVRRHALDSGARVVALSTALAEEGTDLGSNSVFYVKPPRVALAGQAPISGGSFGYAWYAFDQRLRYPFTAVNFSTAGSAAIADYDVLVVPSAAAGALNTALGENGRRRLGEWVRAGGVLITLDAATTWLATEALGLSRFRLRTDSLRADSTGGAPLPATVPGAILRTRGDTLSWLLAGVEPAEVPVLYTSDRVYQTPKDLRAGEVVLRYAQLGELKLTGYVWPEVPERLAATPYLWTERVGQGRVIGFTADPNYRDMWRGLYVIFANAVLMGASR